MSVLPSTANGTELGYQECRDSPFLRYGTKPPDLPSHCGGCEVAFSNCHALDCKKGGLVTACHNYILSLGLASKVPKLTHYGMVLFQTRA